MAHCDPGVQITKSVNRYEDKGWDVLIGLEYFLKDGLWRAFNFNQPLPPPAQLTHHKATVGC